MRQPITGVSAVAGRFKEMDQGDQLLDCLLWTKMSYNLLYECPTHEVEAA